MTVMRQKTHQQVQFEIRDTPEAAAVFVVAIERTSAASIV